MSQTAEQQMALLSPRFAVAHKGVPTNISSRRGIWTVILLYSFALGTVIGVPLYRNLYHFSWIDWSMFALLSVISGLGITVGYHRLMSHRRFDSPNWVKGTLLIVGAWALQNAAIKWPAHRLRHHAHCDEEIDPYNAQQGFWHSRCGWLFAPDRHADPKYATRVGNDPVAIRQHKYSPLLLLAGLAGTFLIGFLSNGIMSGIGCFLLHMYPTDYRNGPRWYHFDPSKWLIHGLYSLGLATSLRTGLYVEDSFARTN